MHSRLLQHSLVLDPRTDDGHGVGGGSSGGGNGSFSGTNMDMVLEPELLPLTQSLTSVSWADGASTDGSGSGRAAGDGDSDAREVVWIDESWRSAIESRSGFSRGHTGYEPSRPMVLALTRGGIGFSIFSVGLPAHPNGSSVLGEAVRCDCHSCELPTSAGGLISTDVSGAGAGEQDDNVSSYIP
jgi:hypothetical protein